MPDDQCKEFREQAQKKCPVPSSSKAADLALVQSKQETLVPYNIHDTCSNYGWFRKLGNGGTTRCAREHQWCHCIGTVVYTKRCSRPIGCGEMSWHQAMSNSAICAFKVNGGITCNNDVFGDPFPGHDKQCFCHPKVTEGLPYDKIIKKWTREACHAKCGNRDSDSWGDFWKGVWCGFSCAGTCPIRLAAFMAGREHTFPLEDCAEFCFCSFYD